MKVTKMARIATGVMFLGATLAGAYADYRAKESYDKMRRSMNDMKKKMFDLRSTANTLSRQMRNQRKQMDAVLDIASDNLYSEKRDALPTQEFDDYSNSNCGDKDFIYTVREHNGVIGIFNEEGELVDEKNVIVESLSACDKHDLSIGILVRSDEELERLLNELK